MAIYKKTELKHYIDFIIRHREAIIENALKYGILYYFENSFSKSSIDFHLPPRTASYIS
jgi:hypothetical protein